MALSNPRIVFGIHSISIRDINTLEPFGIFKVIGDAELALPAGKVDLFGGSSKFKFASETTTIDSTFTASIKTYEDFLFEKFIGAKVTKTSASTTGTIDPIVNQSGTSVVDATTGIASVTLTSSEEKDLKFGGYTVKAVSATTIDIFVDTDINFLSKGADVDYQDDLLKVNATPITIPGTGGTVTLPDFGLTFTGGSGSISFVIGDTSVFDVVPPHKGFSEILIGQSTIQFPEFRATILAQERATLEIFSIDAFKVKASSGITLPLAEGGYSITGVTFELLFDSQKGGVFKIRAITI